MEDTFEPELEESLGCCIEKAMEEVLGQLKAYGPQNFEQFCNELWDCCPTHIQAALDRLVQSGILDRQPWICGDIYRNHTCHAVY